ncbi:MAG: fibronectin type III domain-containing protein [Bacteroidota bacterium]|nr:fibronectin type III domain-containing protein [Bacteroidota bacterium]
MKAGNSILFFVVLAASFMGCKKEAIEVHPELEGHWRTEAVGPYGVVLVIKEGKESFYNNYDRPDFSERGEVKIKEKNLKIGHYEMAITEYPHYNSNGDYGMVIDGYWLIKSITPRVLGVQAFTDHADLGLWFASPGEQGFTNGYFKNNLISLDLQYKLQNAPDWITLTNWNFGSVEAASITGLLPASVYECRMKAHYPWGDSEYSIITIFTTQ